MDPPILYEAGQGEPIVLSWDEAGATPLWVEVESNRDGEGWTWDGSPAYEPLEWTDPLWVRGGEVTVLFRAKFHFADGDTPWSNEVGALAVSAP